MVLFPRINEGVLHQLFAAISAGMGGFSYTAVFGWVTPILPYLLSGESEIPMTSEQASWMISLPEVSNLVSPIPAAILADRIGRKPVILMSAPLFAAGWVVILVFKTYEALIVARLFQGLGMGIALSVIPVYIGEIASTNFRGALTSLFFIMSWFGYLFEYCTGPFLSFTHFTLLTLATCVLYFLVFLLQPESPHFHLMNGDIRAARKSLKWFRCSSEASVNEELESIISSIEKDRSKNASWKEVIATPTDRKALYILLFIGCLRVLSGAIPIVSYATEIFQTTSEVDIAPKYITITLGVVLVVGSLFSFFILDVLGRRPLLITSCLVSSICMFLTSAVFYFQLETTVDVSAYSWVPPVSILIFSGVIVAGLYPVNSAYASELFTSKTRSLASSIYVIVATLFIFIALKFYQDLVNVVGFYFNFLLYGLICLVGGVVSFFCMPETKNKTFEQIRNELAA